jgi:DNA-binding IclR family transcriptional regulator
MVAPENLSVQKAFVLLSSLRGAEGGLSNAELSRRAGLTEACAHRLLKTLGRIGAVVRDSRGNYRPGMALLALSKEVSITDLVLATSADILNDLAVRLNGVLHIGVFEAGMVTYKAKLGALVDVSVPSRIDAQQEAYSCALGKVLLSGLSPEELGAFLSDGALIALTPRTITNVKDLKCEVELVRLRGFAVDDREVYPWISCISAPICDLNGDVVAAVSFTDTAENMCPTWQQEVAGQLVSTLKIVSQKIFPGLQLNSTDLISDFHVVGGGP